MKAVVLETKKGYAAVLAADGTVHKIKRKCNVGDEIQIDARDLKASTNTISFIRKASLTAASIMLVIVGAGTYYTTSTAASYVTVESEAGTINLALNRFNRVISVESTGDDSQEIADELYDMGIKMDTLSDALSKTSEVMSERGVITKDDGPAIEIKAPNDSTLNKLKTEVKKSGFEVENKKEITEKTIEETAPSGDPSDAGDPPTEGSAPSDNPGAPDGGQPPQ